MDGGLLCLKWRDHRSTFFRMLSSVRKKEIYCDATIACDGKFYPVHRLVLSTCSEFFERMFEVADNKHLMIVLTDIQHEYLETLLDYMYIGEVNVLQSDLSSFMKAAECLKIRGLAEPSETNPRKECADSKRNMPQREDGWEIKRRRQNDDLPVNSKPETKSSLGGNSLDNLNSAKVPPRSRTSCGEPKRGRDPSLGHTKINNIPASGIVSPAQLALAELASEKQAGSSSNLTSSLSKDHDNDSSISHDTELSDCKSSQVKFEDVNVKEEPEDWPQAESNEDPQLFRFSDPGLAYLANASTLPLPVQGISQTTQAQTGPLEHSAHPLPGPSGLHSVSFVLVIY
nr:longitudinals lacking protein, isoforms H/M/V-like [Cherax quadricarinatus]